MCILDVKVLGILIPRCRLPSSSTMRFVYPLAFALQASAWPTEIMNEVAGQLAKRGVAPKVPPPAFKSGYVLS